MVKEARAQGAKQDGAELEERVRILELEAREAEARLRIRNARAQLSKGPRRGAKTIHKENEE